MVGRKTKIIIALGSNYEQERNITYAMERLREFFPGIVFSGMHWTEPIGIVSDKFVNALGCAEIEDNSMEEVGQKLKLIEQECGRRTEDKSRNLVKLDLDLLQFGDARLKEKDWKREYMSLLLEEIYVQKY